MKGPTKYVCACSDDVDIDDINIYNTIGNVTSTISLTSIDEVTKPKSKQLTTALINTNAVEKSKLSKLASFISLQIELHRKSVYYDNA